MLQSIHGSFLKAFHKLVTGSESDIVTCLPKGSFVEVHATARGANFELSLAAYLVCVEEGQYFGAANGRFGGWSDCEGWSDPMIIDAYSKPLGKPLGPASWHASNGSWVRQFASGTTVLVVPGGHPPGGGKRLKGASCIRWGDGSSLGTLCGPDSAER